MEHLTSRRLVQLSGVRTSPRKKSQSASFGEKLAQIVARFKLARRIRRERLYLDRMSDHQLRDIGISRERARQEVCRGFFDLPEHRRDDGH